MSANCSAPELTSLDKFVQQNPNCVVFIKKVHDTSCDKLIETLRDERKRPAGEVAWISKSACPAFVGRHKIRGDRNVVIFYGGLPVKRIMDGIPPLASLISTMREVMTDKKAAPTPER